MLEDRPIVEIIYTEDYNLAEWGALAPATHGSAGFDVRACIDKNVVLRTGEIKLIPLGIKMHIFDPGIACVLLPRSGLGIKGLVLGNLVGLIDSDYQGVVTAIVWNRNFRESFEDIIIKPGEKIAQAIFIPVIIPILIPVKSFITTDRGESGFGSSDTGVL